MSRAYEEEREQTQELRLNQHIARELGISLDVLEDHPYRLDENSSDDGVVYSWRIFWHKSPPAGVTAHGAEGSQWSDISEMHEPDSEG